MNWFMFYVLRNDKIKITGGAFVIPYIIVLFLVGRPIYYLEMVVGQFSSRSSVNVFDLCPLFRGTQVVLTNKKTCLKNCCN